MVPKHIKRKYVKANYRSKWNTIRFNINNDNASILGVSRDKATQVLINILEFNNLITPKTNLTN